MTGASGDERSRLDGNAAAGILGEVFAMEMTAASCTCAACGRISAVGAMHLYGGAMGFVLRCPSCQALFLCVTSGPRGYFLELRGVARLPAR
jgi:hypothetical protein